MFDALGQIRQVSHLERKILLAVPSLLLQSTTQLPQKPATYFPAKGRFRDPDWPEADVGNRGAKAPASESGRYKTRDTASIAVFSGLEAQASVEALRIWRRPPERFAGVGRPEW
jgi:hypothetical protein